jgi:hypothetical protein
MTSEESVSFVVIPRDANETDGARGGPHLYRRRRADPLKSKVLNSDHRLTTGVVRGVQTTWLADPRHLFLSTDRQRRAARERVKAALIIALQRMDQSHQKQWVLRRANQMLHMRLYLSNEQTSST